jgi:hypothetical protein
MGSYIANVGGYPFWRNDGECWPYTEPYDFEGLYDDAPGQNHWNDLQFNQATAQYQNLSLPSWGHQLIFGLAANLNFESGCWRDLMLGGIHFTLGDWEAPEMVSASSSVSLAGPRKGELGTETCATAIYPAANQNDDTAVSTNSEMDGLMPRAYGE